MQMEHEKMLANLEGKLHKYCHKHGIPYVMAYSLEEKIVERMHGPGKDVFEMLNDLMDSLERVAIGEYEPEGDYEK